MTKALQQYRPVFMVVTFGFLGMAFYVTYRPRRGAAGGAADCCSPAPPSGKWRFGMMSLNKIMLWGVTVMAVVFLAFPGFITGLFWSGDEITSAMHRTTFRVAGMTCPG